MPSRKPGFERKFNANKERVLVDKAGRAAQLPELIQRARAHESLFPQRRKDGRE